MFVNIVAFNVYCGLVSEISKKKMRDTLQNKRKFLDFSSATFGIKRAKFDLNKTKFARNRALLAI